MEAVELIIFVERAQDVGRRYAMAQRLAVDCDTPRRSAHTRQVMPERRQRRIRCPLDSVAHRSNSSGNNSSANRQAVVVVIIGSGESPAVVVRSLELQYSIGQPIATTRHKLNIQSQSGPLKWNRQQNHISASVLTG